MEILAKILLSTGLISFASILGVFTLSLNEKFLNRILLILISISSGTMLGGAFLHLIPEGLEQSDPHEFFRLVLFAIVLYLVIEKILDWRHCHKIGGQCSRHKSVGYMNLIGDSVHNFIDGLIIAATFTVSVPLGITTTVAIALHEVPQEIGDFGVLLYSGFKKKKALILNFMVALMIVVGGIVGWSLSFYTDNITRYLIPIASGGFIYIAVSDLLPEIRKDMKKKSFIINMIFLSLGIIIMMMLVH